MRGLTVDGLLAGGNATQLAALERLLKAHIITTRPFAAINFPKNVDTVYVTASSQDSVTVRVTGTDR
jgi:hypothetical protein